jgi:hypothetical protein
VTGTEGVLLLPVAVPVGAGGGFAGPAMPGGGSVPLVSSAGPVAEPLNPHAGTSIASASATEARGKRSLRRRFKAAAA